MIVAKFWKKLDFDTHFAELIKKSGTAFVLRVIGIGVGYLFTFLVTRTLGAKSWGIFAICLVVIQVGATIGRLGMDTALLRFTAEYMVKGEAYILKEVYKKALALAISFSTFVAISAYFLSAVLADKVFHKSYLASYFKIASLIIVPFVLLWVHSECIRGLRKIGEYMLLRQLGISVIAMILFLISLYFLKSSFFPIISYGIAILIAAVISICLWRKYLTHLLRTFAVSNSFDSSAASYSAILSVSIPMLLSSSLAFVMGWTDIVMLGMFRSAQEVGIYSVALRVSAVTSISLMAINTIAAPKFAEFWGKGDIKGLAKIARQSTKLIFWTSFPVLLLFLTFPEQVLGIFGKDFKVASIGLMILTIGQFVNAVAGSVGYILQMTGHHKFHQNVMLAGTALNVFLNYFLIPKYGITGAAVASAISVVFWNLIFSCKVKIFLNEWIVYLPILHA